MVIHIWMTSTFTTLHLLKTSGLSFLRYFLHWKCFCISFSGMALFLFTVADLFLFSEIEATVTEASKIICRSESDVSGQPSS